MLDRFKEGKNGESKIYKSKPGDIEATKRVVATYLMRDEAMAVLEPVLEDLREGKDYYGISEPDRKAALRYIEGIGQRSHLNIFDLEPVINELNREAPFSQIKSERQGLAVPKVNLGFLNINSLFAKRLALTAFAGVVAWNCVGSPYNYYYISGEGTAILNEKKANEELARKEELLQQKLKFEDSHKLGLIPSAKSQSNWRVNYLPTDTGYDLVPIAGDKEIKNISNGDSLLIFSAADNRDFSPSIAVKVFERSNGQRLPQLDITTNTGTESWILRDEDNGGQMDIRVVNFENLESGFNKLVGFRVLNTSNSGVEAQGYERVRRVE